MNVIVLHNITAVYYCIHV